MQRTLFATGRTSGKRKHADGQGRLEFGEFRQPALPLTVGVDSGRRGEIDSRWMDAVLAAFCEAKMSTPSLTDLQAGWDAKVSVLGMLQRVYEGRVSAVFTGTLPDSVALAKLNHRPEPIRVIGPQSLPAPKPMLALMAPVAPSDAYGRARALVAKGTSQRQAAKLMGLPITTFRRLIGKVD